VAWYTIRESWGSVCSRFPRGLPATRTVPGRHSADRGQPTRDCPSRGNRSRARDARRAGELSAQHVVFGAHESSTRCALSGGCSRNRQRQPTVEINRRTENLLSVPIHSYTMACQRRWSCARLGVEAAKAAGMMPEHSPRAARGMPRPEDRRPASVGADLAQRRESAFVWWMCL
jgi:hypothetical protein